MHVIFGCLRSVAERGAYTTKLQTRKPHLEFSGPEYWYTYLHGHVECWVSKLSQLKHVEQPIVLLVHDTWSLKACCVRHMEFWENRTAHSWMNHPALPNHYQFNCKAHNCGSGIYLVLYLFCARRINMYNLLVVYRVPHARNLKPIWLVPW